MSPKLPLPRVQVPRNVPLHFERFTDRFHGFDRVAAVQAIFGLRTRQALAALRVEYFSVPWGYMGVSDVDGHLIVSTHYLKKGKPRDIYLDVVHELVHVRQFGEGKELFPDGLGDADTPTEIEAYKHCIAEGRRLGMTDRELFEYLRVEWMNEKELRKLAKNVGVKAPPSKKKPNRNR